MKRHIWKLVDSRLGYKKQRCSVCGAERTNANIYVRNIGGYSKAYLNGKLQSYCPGKK